MGYNLQETALDHSIFGHGVGVGTIILAFCVDDIAVSGITKDSITKPMVSLGIFLKCSWWGSNNWLTKKNGNEKELQYYKESMSWTYWLTLACWLQNWARHGS